jgi:hypothetical protein
MTKGRQARPFVVLMVGAGHESPLPRSGVGSTKLPGAILDARSAPAGSKPWMASINPTLSARMTKVYSGHMVYTLFRTHG